MSTFEPFLSGKISDSKILLNCPPQEWSHLLLGHFFHCRSGDIIRWGTIVTGESYYTTQGWH
jgi:hypothetical protein